MASQSFFQACQEGDVEKLIKLLQSSDEEVNISSKDGYGMTALAYAARNGHVEVVRQLLSRGAERTEVLEQGYGKSNPEIAQLLEEGAAGMGSQGQQVDEAGNHQGAPIHQANDETYMNGAMYSHQGYPMMHAYGGPAQGQHYYYDGNPNNSNGRLSQQGHLRKDSNANNLPPPDVARGIPCKFFPNCRYGDKCVFAHPIMAMPSAGLPGSAPLSPSMSQPPMQPIFYQQIPNGGYPYPGPYGAGPQFYPPMRPMNPMQQHYGMPAQYNPTMVQPMPQQQSNAHVDPSQIPAVFNDDANGLVKEEETTSPQVNSESTDGVFESSESRDVQGESLSLGEVPTTLDHEKDRVSSGTPPQQDGAALLGPSEGEVNTEEKDGVNEENQEEAQGKPIHRRQSFNSFLHHHAVPFQPTLQPGAEMGMMGIPMQQSYPPRMGNKNRRAPGVNGGFTKRHNKDRPACTFFAAGRCRFGEECLFPHILPDGTDARPMQAQQRQMFAAQFGSANTGIRAANGVNGTNGSVNNGVPASAPTGPQAEKKAAAAGKQQQQQQSQQKQDSQSPQQSKLTPQSSSAAANGANVVVRSNPSKTSTQAASTATSSRGAHGTSQKKQQHQSQQPAQRIPTVNDFPALAVPLPNGGQTTLTPLSLSIPSAAMDSPAAAAATTTTPTPALAPTTSPSAVPSSITTNGGPSAPAKANFSAILSAPAPVKPRHSAESSNNFKPATIEEGNQDSDCNVTRVNGDEKVPKQQSQAKSNGVAKDSKARAKDVKAPKVVDSYKGAATGTNKTSTVDAEDADFQLVHRSRSSSKRSPSNHNNSNSNDNFTAQSKAVAA